MSEWMNFQITFSLKFYWLKTFKAAQKINEKIYGKKNGQHTGIDDSEKLQNFKCRTKQDLINGSIKQYIAI